MPPQATAPTRRVERITREGMRMAGSFCPARHHRARGRPGLAPPRQCARIRRTSRLREVGASNRIGEDPERPFAFRAGTRSARLLARLEKVEIARRLIAKTKLILRCACATSCYPL